MKRVALFKFLKKIFIDISVNNVSMVLGVMLASKNGSLDVGKAFIVLMFTITVTIGVNFIITKVDDINTKLKKKKTKSYKIFVKNFIKKLRFLFFKK